MSNFYVLGNGNLLANFNRFSNLTDLYFPYVGHRNHVGGHLCGIAVLTPHHAIWVGEEWRTEGRMLDGGLVAKVRHTHPPTGIVLQLTRAVHPSRNVLMTSIELENPHLDESRLSVAFYHNFQLQENAIGDTAAYLPEAGALMHYKEDTYFLMGARDAEGRSFSRWDIGRRDGSARPGWESISLREFYNTPIRQGNVDSVLVLDLDCPKGAAAAGDYWLVADRTLDAAVVQCRAIASREIPILLEQTQLYWREWVRRRDPRGVDVFAKMPKQHIRALEESLLLVRTQCDNRGGIVAANDTGVLRFNGDHYSYVWPRDAALIARIFLRRGFPDIAERFLEFCSKIAGADGTILHKFRADGTLGSSWHGWLHDGHPALPVQEDEIALPVLLLADYFNITRNAEFVMRMLRSWGRNCLRFLREYVDPATGLPKPSHDLWEERFGVHAFTVVGVCAALERAGGVAQRLGYLEDASASYETATRMKAAFFEHFWSEKEQIFARCIFPDGTKDFTPDSSTHAVWYFDLATESDPRLNAAMETTWNALTVRTGTGGIARYHNDYYHRVTENLAEVPGNPWIISTLWAAQWHLRTGNRGRAEQLLGIALARRNEMGLLPEQWNPYNGAPLSVIPLTWSHAVMAETLAAFNDLDQTA